MAFSYEPALTDARSLVRFEVGDTDPAAPLFEDAEVDAVLAANGDEPLAAAAALCEQLATRFARDVDVELDGQSMKRSQRALAYEKRAAALRARSPRAGGLNVVSVERVDRGCR
jgi:hypothetical protein